MLSVDRMEDSEFDSLERDQEFVFNRFDPVHRLLSQAFRHQRALDALQLSGQVSDSEGADGKKQKLKLRADWIEEVQRRYNVLALLNYAVRECIDTCLTEKTEEAPQS